MWQRLNSQAFREAMHRKFDVDLFDGKPDREARR
jgi:hypothetical protein